MQENMLKIFQKEDSYTANHSRRVANIAFVLGKNMNLCQNDMDMLLKAATLHDIGKTSISPEILNKPERLTDEEFATVKQHAYYGFKIVEPEDADIAYVVLSHHERYDGLGYPNGLAGTNIPYLARIIAVADSLDAMSSDRCYRKALPWETCVSEIDRNRGKMYDPDVVRSFHSCESEILKILSASACFGKQK